MNPNARYAIVPVHYGTAPADAIMVGPLPTIMENIPDSIARRDSLRTLLAARLDAAVITQAQKATRALQVQAFCDGVNTIARRLDALETRRAKRLRQYASARAEAEQQEIRQMLDALPDPEEPASYSPGGELHAVSATNTGDDTEGELPKELLRATPPSSGSYPLDDPAEMDEPSQQKYRNCVAVSLNEVDEFDY